MLDRYANGTDWIVLADIRTDWPDVFGPFVNISEAREGEGDILMATKTVATFTPQAWVRDYAISVYPEGPTEWVTEFEGLTAEQRKLILLTGHDIDDLLKEDPAAPEWVREWSGPFEIHVREIGL